MSEPDAFEFHIICQTHWDREWRLSFQQTRIMLVDMMDHLLDLLENDPNYRHYHLDGQTILLEDYLDIRPENRQRLSALIASGRILVGPWYTLPEENLLDGECLARNLLMGHALARELGGVMKAGFTPTSYGQVSQIPQIYMGFGIDAIFFHRGVPSYAVDLEYTWEGSDGTRILGLRPPLGGRFNFSTIVMNRLLASGNGDAAPYSPVSVRDLRSSSNLKDELSGDGDETYYSETVPSSWEDDTLRRVVEDLRKLTSEQATTPFLLCGEGHDLMEPNPVLPQVVVAANAILGKDRFIISSLPEYLAQVRRSVGDLKVLKGEMRSTQKDETGARLYAGTLSSRIYLKQMNRRVEGLLLKWAEPFSVLMWTLGGPYPRATLQKAWRFLLANHAHDSIAGTGTDQVHDDMHWRFDQSELIARELARKALSRIVGLVEANRAQEGDALITIFNPLPFERDEVVEFNLDLPDTPDHHFRIEDPAGREMDYYEGSRAATIHTVQQTHGFPYRFYVVQHHVSFLAESVPALGYKTYRVEMCSGAARSRREKSVEDRVQITGDRQMENQHLRVKINANGTLSILDKATKKCYDQINGFEDCGEVGDSYEHVKPKTDTVVTSRDCKAAVELVKGTPFAVSFQVKLALNLPEAAAADKSTRSQRRRPLDIVSTVTLQKGARRVDITTRVDNTVRDHRLRVLFPSGIHTDECWAEGQYDVLRRSVIRPDCQGWLEPYCPTQPQLNFVDLTDGKVGLAVINQGLPEYEVFDDDARTIALTLLRCYTHKTRATQLDDPGQVGTQCPGEHEFRYALYPHAADVIEGGVLSQAYRHNHAVKIVQSWKHKRDDGAALRLPMEMSGLSITPGDLVMAGLKQSESGNELVLRFFNPTEREIDGRIRLYRAIARAAYLDLEENVLQSCPPDDRGELHVKAAPKKVVTLGLVLADGLRPSHLAPANPGSSGR